MVQIRTECRLGIKNIDPRGRRIGNDEHVGGIDHFPAANARAVEPKAFGENVLVVLGQRGREMLPGTGQIGKLEIHEFDLVILDYLADVGWSFFVWPWVWLRVEVSG